MSIGDGIAFPSGDPHWSNGMTYRQWLIGQALTRFGITGNRAIELADATIAVMDRQERDRLEAIKVARDRRKKPTQ